MGFARFGYTALHQGRNIVYEWLPRTFCKSIGELCDVDSDKLIDISDTVIQCADFVEQFGLFLEQQLLNMQSQGCTEDC